MKTVRKQLGGRKNPSVELVELVIIHMPVWKLLIFAVSNWNLIITIGNVVWKEILLNTITSKLKQEYLSFHLVKTNSYWNKTSMTLE